MGIRGGSVLVSWRRFFWIAAEVVLSSAPVLPAGYPRAYPGQGPASTGPPPAAGPLLACRPLSGALSCALPSGDPAPLLEFWTVPPPGACSRRWLLRSNLSTLPELPDLSGSTHHGRAVCDCPAVALRPLGFVACFARLYLEKLEPARLACLVDSAVTKSHGTRATCDCRAVCLPHWPPSPWQAVCGVETRQRGWLAYLGSRHAGCSLGS